MFDVQGGDIAEDANGNWFLWSNATESLYRLDATNAVVTPVDATASSLGFTTGLAFDYQGGNALLASSRSLGALLTLDTTTGLATSQAYFCLTPPATHGRHYEQLSGCAGLRVRLGVCSGGRARIQSDALPTAGSRPGLPGRRDCLPATPRRG